VKDHFMTGDRLTNPGGFLVILEPILGWVKKVGRARKSPARQALKGSSMNHRSVPFAVFLAWAGAALGGCAGPPAEKTSLPEAASVDAILTVFVVNYPLKYFAERIGGALVEVEFPAPAGIDPAFWSPDPETVAAYQAADLILLNGAGYAKWVERASLPAARMVDTSGSFQDRYLEVEGTVVHAHGPEGAHSHGETAFTTWLDPTLAVEQAGAIRDAFVVARPHEEVRFVAGFEALKRDLDLLDTQLEEVTKGSHDLPLLASHPVYQYLVRRYDLHLRSVHFEPEEFPGENEWRTLTEILKDHPAQWLIWEGEPQEKTRERLRDLGVECIVFDPCGNVPATGDYLTVMASNVRNLRRILSGS
jgi:zinc transport system substrate-binding protein